MEIRVLAPLAAGLPLIVLACWLAYLDFENRLHRALALFLFLRGAANISTGFLEISEWRTFWLVVTPYFGVALPLSAIHFAYRYLADRGHLKHREWIVGLLILGAAVLEILYFFDHGMFTSRNLQGRVVFGPLFLSVGALYVIYALIANRLGKDYLAEPAATRRTSLLLVALGFSLATINTGFYYLLAFPPGPPNLPGSGSPSGGPPPVAAIVAGLMLAASSLVLAPLVWRLLRDRRQNTPTARAVNRTLLVMLGPVATAIIAAAAGFVSQSLSVSLVQVFGTAWTLAFAGLLAFAVVRHRLFDIDARLRISIRRGTLAAFFVAAFFAVAEIAQTYLTERFDWLLGTLGAGLLLFAIHPLQRFAQRFADAAVPKSPNVAQMSATERSTLFLEQARIAWADGAITRKERLLLDHTRKRLGISLDDAHRLERLAMGAQ